MIANNRNRKLLEKIAHNPNKLIDGNVCKLFEYQIWSPFTFKHSKRGPLENYPVNWALIVPNVMSGNWNSCVQLKSWEEIVHFSFSPVRAVLSFFLYSFINSSFLCTVLHICANYKSLFFSFIFTSVCTKNSWIDTNQISVGLNTQNK